MNTISISGRLTQDPVIQKFESSTKCTFFIANNVYYGENKTTNFLKVFAWNKKAELIQKYFKTGMEIFINGRLEQYRYEDENQKTVYDNSIVLEEFEFGNNPKSQDSTD